MKKIISVILILVLLVNLLLFAFRKISQLYFWLIIAVIGIIAFQVMPRMK